MSRAVPTPTAARSAPPDRPAPGDAIREQLRLNRSLMAHRRRCQAAGPPPNAAEVARMVAEFHARGGKVTVCLPVHLLPVQNGAGRDADRWTA